MDSPSPRLNPNPPTFPAVVRDPEVMGGVPVIRGTRLPARMLFARIKGGETVDSIVAEYPYLGRDAILAAVAYVEMDEAQRPA